MEAVLNDLTIFGIFMSIAFLIREKVKTLQKYFFSTSIIAGLMALLLGPQIFGVVAEMPETFNSYAGVLVRFVMASMVFGVTVNLDRIRSVGDFICIETGAFGAQMALSLAVGAILCMVWPTLPEGWGYIAFTSFYGGHGTAATAGGMLQEITGNSDYMGYGIVLSSIGLLVAVIFGMIVVNVGIRKGWAVHVDKIDSNANAGTLLGGRQAEDERVILGKSVVSSLSLNAVTLQMAFVLSGMFLGEQLFPLIGRIIPFFATFPYQACDVFGCVILTYLMRALKLNKYIDRKTVTQLNGIALDMVVFGALATLNVEILTNNFVPIFIISVVVCSITIFGLLFICRRLCSSEWFEKATFFIGQMTGTNATGFALLRTLDPNSQSLVWEAQGITAGVGLWFDLTYVIAPQLVGSGNILSTIGLGTIIFIIGIILAWVIKKKS